MTENFEVRIADLQRTVGDIQRIIGEIQSRLGKIEGLIEIWLPERQEMLRARKEIFERLSKLESTIAEMLLQIREIHFELQKVQEMRNRIIGAAMVISFLSAIAGQLLLKWLQ